MKDMTPRERILEAINHRVTDMLPIDFGGMRSTGINVVAYNKLKDYFGIKGKPAKLYDIFQQLAEPEEEVLEKLGGDVVQAHRLCPAFGIRIDKWKNARLDDGSECLVPVGYNPVEDRDGNRFLMNGSIAVAKMPKGGFYYDSIYRPYENTISIEDIDRVEIPGITDEELDFLEIEARKLYETTDRAILFAFGGNVFEAGQINWGYEKFFIDMAINPDLVHYWANKLTDVYMSDLEKIMKAIGRHINVIQFGDDLGSQEALQISPDMYRKMIKPYHARMYQYIRNNHGKVKVFLHSCGAIFDLIPDLIDAGVEILNPVQISAKGMNPVKLKKEFGKYLTFWGGGANMQYTVNLGSIEQIKREVGELIDIFAPGGGFVFNQIHNIQANIPPEKIKAIYNTALAYRKSKI